ncbi:hypothetical protein [Massilia sp. PWRC2]|uniref:hypothetical protein n=1 Tax=Massilia sp. PWRC2 TaxID=2804626 RepID=UPI003CE9E1C5
MMPITVCTLATRVPMVVPVSSTSLPPLRHWLAGTLMGPAIGLPAAAGRCAR